MTTEEIAKEAADGLLRDPGTRRKVQRSLASGMTMAQYKIQFLASMKANPALAASLAVLANYGISLDAIVGEMWKRLVSKSAN